MNKLLNITRLKKNIYSYIEKLISKYKPIVAMLAVDPFAAVLANTPLSPEDVGPTLEVIRYIATCIKDGYDQGYIVNSLVEQGWDLTIEGFLYGVKAGLQLGLIIKDQIPINIYEQLGVEGFKVAAEIVSRFMEDVVAEQVYETYGLAKSVVDTVRESITAFLKDHPIIVGFTIAAMIGVVILGAIVKKPEMSPDSPDKASKLQDVVDVVDVVDNLGYITYSTIMGLLMFFYLALYLYHYRLSKRRTSSS